VRVIYYCRYWLRGWLLLGRSIDYHYYGPPIIILAFNFFLLLLLGLFQVGTALAAAKASNDNFNSQFSKLVVLVGVVVVVVRRRFWRHFSSDFRTDLWW